MLSIPGKSGSTCDGFSRREFLRVGGAGLFGLSLGDVFRLQAGRTGKDAGPGWGNAKSVILLFLQGGPSHIDLFDPKPALDRLTGQPMPSSFGKVVTAMGTASNTPS